MIKPTSKKNVTGPPAKSALKIDSAVYTPKAVSLETQKLIDQQTQKIEQELKRAFEQEITKRQQEIKPKVQAESNALI